MSDTYETAGAIRRALLQIIDHYDVALIAPRRGGSGGGRAPKEPPPPVSVEVLDARRDAHKDLVYYAQVVLMECRSIEEGQIVTRVDGSNPRALAKFLDTWAEHLVRGNPTEGEACARDLAEHAKKLRGMALPDRREWMPLGTCPLEVEVPGKCRCHPADDDSGHCRPAPTIEACGGQVRAYPGRDPYCMKCGTEAVASWWERVMFPDVELSELVTADELVMVLYRAFGKPVTQATLRQWKARGVIVASGKDDKGRTLYARSAVVYAVARRMERIDA